MWQVICLLNLKEVFKIKFFKESNFCMIFLSEYYNIAPLFEEPIYTPLSEDVK